MTLASTEDKLEQFLSLSLEELVSLETTIATATKRTASKAPAVVTLITADDIKATGATNLADILQTVPGIHVRYMQFANRPIIHFRGTSGNQTLLMINGNTMKDLTWNLGIFWKGLPVSIIDRIEIIRGPGSAVFGADASAGVVNVITKTAGRIKHSEAGIRAGSFNTHTAWMQHGTNVNGYEIGFTANLSTTDGYSPYIASDQQSVMDAAFATNVSYAPGDAEFGWDSQDLRFSIAKEHWRLHADYRSNRNVDIGFTGAGALSPNTEGQNEGEDSRFNLDLFYNNHLFSKHLTLDAELRYQHLDYTSGDGFFENPPGYTDDTGTYPDGLINQNRAAERRLAFQTSAIYTGIKDHALRLGLGYTWQDLYSVTHRQNFGTAPDGSDIPAASPLIDLSGSVYAFAPEKTRKISHLFIEDAWTLSDNLELTVGGRYDDYSDFGNTFNPRLALVWQTTEKLTSKLIYGKAFRPPTYNELYADTSRSDPNPNLKPESIETLELAYSYAANKRWLINTNLFYLDQTDLIKQDQTSQFQNTLDHSIKGIELEVHWQASQAAQFSANYTLRSQDEDRPAIQEANQEAYVRSDWRFLPNWNWNIQASWIGERSRRSNDTRDPVAAFTIFDSTLRYASSDNLEFAASIRNLFDEDARDFTGGSIAEDLPLPGRNAYAELVYKF